MLERGAGFVILELLYVGFAVKDVDRTRRAFRDLFGLSGEWLPPDIFLGVDKGARIAFPNRCWLYVMESSRAESPVYQYIHDKGPGLERLAFLTDDVEAGFEHIRQEVPSLSEDELVDTPFGRRFAIPGSYLHGVTVELIQPVPGVWEFDSTSHDSHVLGLQHIGVAVRDLEATSSAFERLFDLPARDLRIDQHGGEQRDVMIEPGNDRLWLHVTESWGENARVRQFLNERGEGLEHLCIEVEDIREAVVRVTGQGVPIFEDKIFTNRPDGFEAFVYSEHTTGVTVELIEPYPTSRGYRPRK
jgi:methylmalonyl-CoA/ethylmalonyl-CoA epimerase